MKCPGCSIEWVSGPSPVPGEPTLCQTCGVLAVFTDDGCRETTLDEEAAFFERYPMLDRVAAAIRWDVVCRKIARYQQAKMN